MRTVLARLLAGAVLAAGASCAGSSRRPSEPAHPNPAVASTGIEAGLREPPVHIQVLAIDDFHGNLEPPAGSSGVVVVPPDDPILKEHPAGATPDRDGRVAIPAGGAAYLAAHVRRLRRSNPNTVFVSAGDLTGASPLISNLFLDEPTILAMNAMGLDYEGVGNHDFDRGLAELERLAHGGCSLADCKPGSFPGAHFGYLAANVRTQSGLPGDEGRTLFPPYGIRDVAGVRLAFVGLTLEATPTVTVPDAVRGLTFTNEAQAVNRLLPELAEQRVDKVIVLIHQGAHQRGTYDACDGLSGDLLGFLDALSPAVDVVVSGHTHEPYNCVVHGRLVTSAASYGRLITRIDLTWDPAARRWIDQRAENLVVTRDVAPDDAVGGLVERYARKAEPITSRVVGYVKGTFARGNLAETPHPGERRVCESPAGELIADAQLFATHALADGGADIAFMNPGGVRTDLLARGGESTSFALTYAEAFEVQPFGNRLVTVTLTGAQIRNVLDLQLEVGRLLQVSKGFSYRLLAGSAPEERPRIEPSSVVLNGKPLDAKRKYRVTVNSFLAAGGDRFSVFLDGRDRKDGVIDVDALTAYLAKTSSPAHPIEPTVVGGRIGGDVCR